MDDLLRRFLAERNARCPECGYALRALESPICPECGRRLQLTLAGDRSWVTAWGVLLGSLGLVAGNASLRLLREIFTGFSSLTVIKAMPWHWLLVYYFGLLSPCLFLVVLLSRRRIARWPRRVVWSMTAFVLAVFSIEPISFIIGRIRGPGPVPRSVTSGDVLFALAVVGIVVFAIFGHRWTGNSARRTRRAGRRAVASAEGREREV